MSLLTFPLSLFIYAVMYASLMKFFSWCGYRLDMKRLSEAAIIFDDYQIIMWLPTLNCQCGDLSIDVHWMSFEGEAICAEWLLLMPLHVAAIHFAVNKALSDASSSITLSPEVNVSLPWCDISSTHLLTIYLP